MFITGYTSKRTCTEQCSMAFFERKTMENRVHLWDLLKLWIISFGKLCSEIFWPPLSAFNLFDCYKTASF